MAQAINTTLNHGLFKADKFDFEIITENKFNADLSECKDAVTVVVDLSNATGKATFACLSPEGKTMYSVALTTGCMNVFRITTHGIKNANGIANFAMTADTAISSAGIKVGFLKYVSVINN